MLYENILITYIYISVCFNEMCVPLVSVLEQQHCLLLTTQPPVTLLAFISADDVLPVVVFIGIVAGAFWLLTQISKRNSLAEEIGRAHV